MGIPLLIKHRLSDLLGESNIQSHDSKTMSRTIFARRSFSCGHMRYLGCVLVKKDPLQVQMAERVRELVQLASFP
jgi:hypothetical protein